MSEKTDWPHPLTRALLTAILVVFFVLGLVYSVVVPPFEASDEKWHYPMVKYIADHWSLPVQEPGVETSWRQEGSQPPLYYFLGALTTCWIDTSDMETVRHLNPHVDPGATPDGNVNLVVHYPVLESFPWRGTVLAVHLVRLLSVLMGTAAVYLTYLIVREVLPGEPILALGAAAIHAFTPMYIFISGAVNNDNLVVPLSSLALLMLLTLAKVGRQSTFARVATGRYLSLGVVLGLAVLTKSNSLGLTVLTALVVVVRAVRRRSWAEFFLGGLATLVPLLLIAGWWYLRNLRLYGDLTGLNVFTEILGTRDVPADLAQLWRERYSFLAGYWGNFGGLNVPMAPWTYNVLNTLTVVASLGLVALLLRHLLTPYSLLPTPFLICLLWGFVVIVPWLFWASTTWSSQGRLIFPAISVWSLLLALGLTGWLPRRWGFAYSLLPTPYSLPLAVFALFLLGLSAVAPFAWIAPAYALPEPLTEAQVAVIPHRLEAPPRVLAVADFGGVVRLLGYDGPHPLTQSGDRLQRWVEPGGQVEVTLYWEALAPTDRDYTVFVHLLGEHDLLVAQRDAFPGLGRLSTMWLEPGFRWADRYVLHVPATAYAPDVAQVEVGLYDGASGVRLALAASVDNVRFGRVAVRACHREYHREYSWRDSWRCSGDYPNPIFVNFGDQMALVGYDLDQRAVRPGETVTLTLYWRGSRRMDVNYTISAQLVDPGQRKAAQHDGWPLDGDAPTAAWGLGQVAVDVRTLATYPDTPPGVYDVRVAVYVLKEGEIVHLPVIPEGGGMLSDHVLLTRVRVEP